MEPPVNFIQVFTIAIKLIDHTGYVRICPVLQEHPGYLREPLLRHLVERRPARVVLRIRRRTFLQQAFHLKM